MSLEPGLVTANDLVKHLRNKQEPWPQNALVLDQSNILDRLEVSEKVQFEMGIKYRRLSPELTAVAGLGIGGPAMAILIEILASVGVKKIVSIGTAGALSEALRVGDILVVERAYDDDGTARHYGSNEVYSPSMKTLHAWNQNLTSMAPKGGGVWSTSALFRETRSRLKKFRELGCLAVEMEAAAAFAVGKSRDVEVTCIRIISDYVFESGWQPHLKSDRLREARAQLLNHLMSKPWP